MSSQMSLEQWTRFYGNVYKPSPIRLGPFVHTTLPLTLPSDTHSLVLIPSFFSRLLIFSYHNEGRSLRSGPFWPCLSSPCHPAA